MAIQISDGSTTPHATDYADLLAKLKTFALANGWTSLEDTSDKLVLQGEGSGTDEIIVAIQKYANVGADSYGWRLNGYTAYQSGYAFLDQPGAIQAVNGFGHVSMPLWNSSIPYWFIASGRRIIVVAKVGTTYQACYLGFFLPFASPNQYPYPLAIGGSRVDTFSNTARYSVADNQSSNFWNSLNTSGTGTMFFRMPGGSWYSARDASNGSGGVTTGMFPYNQADITLMRQALDGSPVLTPIEFQSYISSPSLNVNRLGELDGVFHIAGFDVSAEDVVTVGSDDYVVIPNVFRSGAADYAALKLV